ncbi:MAG: dipeptidase [Anaerolineaceae bacterium]
MPYIMIDGHEDLAYNHLTFGRNYLNSALQTRESEKATIIPERGGGCMLGFPEWQKAKVAFIFSTIFAMPKQFQGGDWEKVTYKTANESKIVYQLQFDYYERLADENQDKFQIIQNLKQFINLWDAWNSDVLMEHPIGMILLMEGAEGLSDAREISEWYEKGLRIAGPVWAGTKFCGGSHQPGRFTRDGKLLLEIMADHQMGLDLSHMTEESALEALDLYPGVVLASHNTSRSLMNSKHGERLLTDLTIRRLIERDGVIGVMPYNYFLVPDWTKTSQRDKVTLNNLVDHIDHICQLAGNVDHVAIGTDFDGTIGFPEVPLELNSIADMPLLSSVLKLRGYQEQEIEKIFGFNWKRLIERILPA